MGIRFKMGKIIRGEEYEKQFDFTVGSFGGSL